MLAYEQEDMIDRYLDKGAMFVLDDNGIKGECVITDEDSGVLEIKNIAIETAYQGMRYEKALVDFVVSEYKDQYTSIQVGTGDSPLTIPFYERCGFIRSHIVKNFFTDYYDRPIFDQGIRTVDMIYLKRML